MKKNEKDEKDKVPYRAFSFKLHEGTVERMKKKKGGLSWNRYFYKLTKKDVSRD